MTEEQRINDLIAKLDSFMEQGGGHMNVQVSDLADEVNVETYNSLICNSNMACSVPTLHQGLDEEI